ncbi:DUF1566 domain-containing protein [Xylella fastidiosa subsp. multiplex]|uniref:Lcl C-terminal domain-containing protein n=1 Tax=Xylella fastidiosa TaxID=2371 RepID=UPI001463F01C|nr:DUF1566 domain-containing protein [Xylella fastidiosa]QJP49620.1 DUF1566 domain-containing protein [Xylella fastidiosa subsp. multiplex]
MSTATLENAPTPGGARFTKIYDEHGDHIITRDEHKGLEWTAHALDSRHAAGFGNMLSRSGAKKVCRELTLGGHTDWRVPEIEEAMSIGLVDTCWPANEKWFWTCTPCEQEPENKAWAFEFGTGNKRIEDRRSWLHVRAVRGQMRTDATATPKAGES